VENQPILFCGTVAHAKIEFSPAEESGNQGSQLRGKLVIKKYFSEKI
jgi:hypothetical protein